MNKATAETVIDEQGTAERAVPDGQAPDQYRAVMVAADGQGMIVTVVADGQGMTQTAVIDEQRMMERHRLPMDKPHINI